jgi:hypothetical protein
MPIFTVFLSRKSSDAKMAKTIYDYLSEHKISVFDSDISLDVLGKSEYQSTIDTVLEKAEHLIVIGSSIENITSSWVRTEWETFENEKRSGRKKGNILVIISKKIKIENLPLALRQKQVLIFEEKNYDRLLPYLGGLIPNPDIQPTKLSFYSKYKHFIIFLSLGVIFLSIWGIGNLKETNSSKNNKLDSIYVSTREQFLFEGLDKEVTFETFKELIKQDIQYLEKCKGVFDEKSISTPVLKKKYYALKEKLIIYADSVHKIN